MKKLGLIVLALILIGGAYAAYLWFKPHRDIEGEAAKYELTAAELGYAYGLGQDGANEIYLDQVVVVSGVIGEVDDVHIKLQDDIFCKGDFSKAGLSSGDKVSIKGRVVGYDDLFQEVRLDN
ncbi:MAG: OB-fold protein, partial [Owenweeksia sp.]